MQEKYAHTNLLLPSELLLGNSAEALQAQGPIVEQFVSAPLPRDENLALVDDWDCLRVSSQCYKACCCCAKKTHNPLCQGYKNTSRCLCAPSS